MHLLLIIVLLALAFPFFARLLGSIVSVMFWLIAVGTIVAIVSAIF